MILSLVLLIMLLYILAIILNLRHSINYTASPPLHAHCWTTLPPALSTFDTIPLSGDTHKYKHEKSTEITRFQCFFTGCRKILFAMQKGFGVFPLRGKREYSCPSNPHLRGDLHGFFRSRHHQKQKCTAEAVHFCFRGRRIRTRDPRCWSGSRIARCNRKIVKRLNDCCGVFFSACNGLVAISMLCGDFEAVFSRL